MRPYEPTYSFNLGPRRDDPSMHCVDAPIPQPPEIPDDVWYFLLVPETYYFDILPMAEARGFLNSTPSRSVLEQVVFASTQEHKLSKPLASYPCSTQDLPSPENVLRQCFAPR